MDPDNLESYMKTEDDPKKTMQKVEIDLFKADVYSLGLSFMVMLAP